MPAPRGKGLNEGQERVAGRTKQSDDHDGCDDEGEGVG
jgi:hypothetical protein